MDRSKVGRRLSNFIGVFVVALTFLGVFVYNKSMNSEKVLKIWSPRIPFSVDPLEYDALAHHICFRSISSSLVSDYKLGTIQGVIASKWKSSEENRVWTFFIRSNLTFSNGQVITPQSVAFSLNRAAYIMKINNSESGIFENVEGLSGLNTPAKLVDGIAFDDESVTLTFVKSMPDLLEKISFGLYAVVHPDDFDALTGKWKDPKRISSSGPYALKSWNASSLQLELRSNYPKELLLSNPIQNVEFRFSKNDIETSDLIVDFDDSLAVDESYRFYGPVKSAIRYVSCEGWKNPKSICFNHEDRVYLRDSFYRSLASSNFKVVKSFFPLAIQDVVEMELPRVSEARLSQTPKEFRASKVAQTLKNVSRENETSPSEAFENAISKVAEELGVGYSAVPPVADVSIDQAVDFKFKMTAILVDSPLHDVQFMFLSKQGIRLPDSTGAIKDTIRQASFSVQRVNEILWDQAIIWPFNHMALGIWKRNDEISLKHLNLVLPPLDLQWIEWN